MRPDELSGDLTSSDDVILHALDFYKEKGIAFNEVCKLQPTSPLRNENNIIEAYDLFRRNNANYVVSVCECEHSPLWCGNIAEDLRMDKFISEEAKRACRQNLPIYYRINGAIYMGKTETYCVNKSFLGEKCLAYIMRQEDSIDIDSQFDFRIAEIVMKG